MKHSVIRSFLTGIVMLFITPVLLQAATYPSDYTIVYHRISVTVNPGVSGAISNGSVTTYFKTKIANFSAMGFDFDQAMTVASVFYHGSSIAFSHASNTVTFSVTNIPTKGTLDSITINFNGTPVAPVTSVPSGYNYSSTYKCIYTLGESFRGSTWWPCRDSLVNKIDSVDMIITTPSGYRAGSNGVVTEAISGSNRICTWKTRYPIATYLINFAAADYTDYAFTATSLTHTVPLHNYLYTSSDFNATYKSYLNMLQNVMPAYATLLNTDYPFYGEKYGTAESGSGWGALEVQSMTFIDRTSYSGGYTLAHELAHQWFGDHLTTGDWHHIWLNEGFAQFFQSVIYPEQLLSASTAASQRSSLKSSVGTSSTVYVTNISNADNIFIGSTTQPYEKGAMMLSMLRSWLGYNNFYNALHDYQNAPGLSYNFTYPDSLRKYMQPYTSNDLTAFFNDWIFQKGQVTYAVKYQYVTKGVYIQLTQAPTYSGAGYFDMPIPLEIKNSSGLDTTIVVIDRNGVLYNQAGNTFNSNTIYYSLSATPTIAPVFDPNSEVLATASSTASSGTLSTMIVLPVQDIEFSVSPVEHTAKLNWNIAVDEPLRSLEVEKSVDGINFNSIAKLATVPNAQGNYQSGFTDEQANEGIAYYRLKLYKTSGSVTYSVVKIASFSNTGNLTLLPNPVHDMLTIKIPSSFQNQSSSISLSVYNAMGVLVKSLKVSADKTTFYINCKAFSAGLYKIIASNEKQQQLNSQFLKQ